MNMLRRTRIVCTIGPSSASPQVMRAMVQAGMDVARLNFSHGDAETHRAAAKAVREAADDTGRPVALLGARKGISVPGRPLPLPALTAKDIEDLKLAVELEVDYLALSFVRRPEDVIDCQQHVTGMNRSIPVIAKLEKLEAIRNLAKILEVADAVMVARGDLGVELKLGELPAVQKDVIDQANRAGVPVITATEMLESMVTAN